jgi:hypothetical protein
VSITSAPKTDFEQSEDAAIPSHASREAFVAWQLAACDPILHPLIRESDELRRDQLIETLLVDHLGGIIKRTLQRKLNSLSGGGRSFGIALDDIRSTVAFRLLKRLRALPEGGPPIENLAGYATTTALHAWEDSLREAFPQRTLLKNRIRYLLHRDDRFALWHAPDQMVCGFAQGQCGETGAAEPPDAGEVRSSCNDATSLPEVLLTLFRIAGAPVELEAVVTVVARVSGIVDDVAPRVMDSESGEGSEAPVAAEECEHREILRKLWTEIVALNPPQRASILLNLRDDTGDTATPLFVTTGVATVEEIAATLAIPVNDFAVLWNDLPIEDAVIAGMLGVTRQQVINYRSSARKRLARRMRRF